MDSGIDEPAIVETHQNNFTISSFDENSIVHDHTSASKRQDGESLVIDQQASNTSYTGGDTLEQRNEAEVRKGTIDESLDSSYQVKVPKNNESSITSDDPSSSELSKGSPLPPQAAAKKEKAKNKQRNSANAESPVLKSQDIFGAVKIKDGLFLGDQYSPQVRNSKGLLTIIVGIGSGISCGKQDFAYS